MLIALYDVIIYDVTVTSSTLKTFMKLWGTCFKFWRRPCNGKIKHILPESITFTLTIINWLSESYKTVTHCLVEQVPEAYSEPSEISEVDLFCKTIYG